MTTKILESIAISINDILGDRVKRFARYLRNLHNDQLKDYNSIDALAYTVYRYLDNEKINTNIEDIRLALPGKLNNQDTLMLFTNLRIIIVENDDNRFIPKEQIYYRECQLHKDNEWVVGVNKKEIMGKHLGFVESDGERYLHIFFDAVRRKCFLNWMKRNYEIKITLQKFDEQSIIHKRYTQLLDDIFAKHSDNELK
jgi:hypothetical protein